MACIACVVHMPVARVYGLNARAALARFIRAWRVTVPETCIMLMAAGRVREREARLGHWSRAGKTRGGLLLWVRGGELIQVYNGRERE